MKSSNYNNNIFRVGMFIILTTICQSAFSQLIQNVFIVDGTGAKSYKGAVRIKGDKIIAVGNLQIEPGETDRKSVV